ncbi:protein CHUP1, chloroplastic-like [Hordeum vulgare]|nr:protein CHUP1, chloroplastic-like [Hordeum vulgare]
MRCQGFEQPMEEMKQLVLELQKENGTNSENAEVVVEGSMREDVEQQGPAGGAPGPVGGGHGGADLPRLDHAWLQHDLLARDGEGGNAKAQR